MVDKKQNDKQQPGFMWFRIETFSVTLQTPDVKLFFFYKRPGICLSEEILSF